MIRYINSSEFKDFYRIFSRCLLLFLPFVMVELLENIVLPVDLFSFRVWEGALADPYRYPGAFYPNLHVIKKHEYGDMYRMGVKISKRVEWFTDSYGWRNRPEVEKHDKYDAVIIGDSNIVGSFLDQKDTLAEVLSNKTNRIVYSYSIGHDGVSLFFSDPRFNQKKPKLLIVETKVINWMYNNSALYNFEMDTNNILKIRSRKSEFDNYFYSANRNYSQEFLISRFKKQALWHSLKATLLTDFTLQSENQTLYIGSGLRKRSVHYKAWHPSRWIVDSGIAKVSRSETGETISIRSKDDHAYWHTEKFLSSNKDGKITIRFNVKNSITVSKYKLWIFEDGSYRSIGQFIADNKWKTIEIPIATNPGSVLEFQIDQPNNWQWMTINDFEIINAKSYNNHAIFLHGESIKTKIVSHKSSEITSNSISVLNKPIDLTPIDNSGRELSIAESRYYFYMAVKEMNAQAKSRGMDFILFVMPDLSISRLTPAIRLLRKEGIKIIAYDSDDKFSSGVDPEWFWQHADSHWTEAAVRLTADEISRMWSSNSVKNRSFTKALMSKYT